MRDFIRIESGNENIKKNIFIEQRPIFFFVLSEYVYLYIIFFFLILIFTHAFHKFEHYTVFFGINFSLMGIFIFFFWWWGYGIISFTFFLASNIMWACLLYAHKFTYAN